MNKYIKIPWKRNVKKDYYLANINKLGLAPKLYLETSPRYLCSLRYLLFKTYLFSKTTFCTSRLAMISTR
jgi:hypothetical protein